MHLADLDLWIFHAINGLSGKSAALDLLARTFDISSVKSIATFALFGMLWHFPSADPLRQRKVLLMLFVAVVVSLALNRAISLTVPFRVRPMYAPDIGFQAPMKEFPRDLEDWSSFPSDNATLLFAITTSFWLVSRAWGIFFALFSAVSLLARIYSGVHYPSDVVVGALLGVGVTLAINRDAAREIIAGPALKFEKHAPALFYGVLFAGLFETATLFALTRRFGKALYHLLVS